MAIKIIETTVEIDLNDFDSDDLIEELSERLTQGKRKHLKKNEVEDLKDLLSLVMKSDEGNKIKTLDDQCKYEHFMNVFDKYTATELEQLLTR